MALLSFPGTVPDVQDENLLQVRVERSETTEPPAATARRASEASHPARPTNVKMALAALFCYLQFQKIRTCRRFGSNAVRQRSRLRRRPERRAKRVILHDLPIQTKAPSGAFVVSGHSTRRTLATWRTQRNATHTLFPRSQTRALLITREIK